MCDHTLIEMQSIFDCTYAYLNCYAISYLLVIIYIFWITLPTYQKLGHSKLLISDKLHPGGFKRGIICLSFDTSVMQKAKIRCQTIKIYQPSAQTNLTLLDLHLALDQLALVLLGVMFDVTSYHLLLFLELRFYLQLYH